MEWGTKAYELMWEIKRLFDPAFVLNPGVVLNRDPNSHRKFLKPSPVASEIVDRCIECGFCESNCPSRDITLTPRQRIATYKEIARLRRLPQPSDAEKKRLTAFEKLFEYDGDATCAADGMCQQKCPVKINTGTAPRLYVVQGSNCTLRQTCVTLIMLPNPAHGDVRGDGEALPPATAVGCGEAAADCVEQSFEFDGDATCAACASRGAPSRPMRARPLACLLLCTSCMRTYLIHSYVS
jgi:ferredoxin